MPDENGLLTYYFENMPPQPVVIDGKRLTLPLPELLRSGNWDGKVAFHPFSESIVRADSPVLRKFRNILQVRMTTIFSELLGQLIEVAAKKDVQKKMAPHAQELLAYVVDADEKTVANLTEVLERVEMEGPNRLLSIVLRKGGRFKDAKRAAVALVTLPLLDQLDSPDGKLLGVKLRKKDFAALRGLINYILPNSDDVETYSASSDSMVAPGFDALLKAYANLARAFNRVINIQRKQLNNEKELHTELEWEEFAQDLTRYRGEIPALDGNVGGADEDETKAVPQAIASGQSTADSHRATADSGRHDNAQDGGRKGVFNTNMTYNKQQPHGYGIRVGQGVQPAAASTGHGIQMGAINQGGQGQGIRVGQQVTQQQFNQQAAAPAEVARTKNGLDFRSLMQTQQQTMQRGYTYVGQPQQQQPMMQYPSWVGQTQVQQYQQQHAQVPPGSYANDPRFRPQYPQYGHQQQAGYGYQQGYQQAGGF